ncbi:Zn-dependent exopeptidase [Daedalea quercina L-15889]|uniref:Peptide hydrolase n=1 Tax=Daedalea quercina L-15889 TaxID=1314783 RepID=A0A165QG22_9APHY|nr:Zn-dependent exopeptidase [Daedalea quercina L-15889]
MVESPGVSYAPVVLSDSPTSMVISVAPEVARTLDIRLPRLWKSTPIPQQPVPYVPVSSTAVQRVKAIAASVKFDPVVASIVGNISIPQMRKDVRYLTGEDPSSGIMSRHAFSKGALQAAAWLQEQFQSTGASCELKPFLRGFSPNVVCTYAATEDTTETMLLSAHYDSRGSFGSIRAPGGDDDGSGVTALLAIARTIAHKGIAFRKNIQLVAFSGEEQGLYGSKAYAREMYELGANLTLMIQADMLGYRAPGEPAQLGLPESIGSLEVMQLVSNISAIYSPELVVGTTRACCSDHQSFHELGFPATQVFERAGPIADPMYHNSGDLSDREGYDFEQIRSIAKVQVRVVCCSLKLLAAHEPSVAASAVRDPPPCGRLRLARVELVSQQVSIC